MSEGSLRADKSSSRVSPPVASDKIVRADLTLSGEITTFPVVWSLIPYLKIEKVLL